MIFFFQAEDGIRDYKVTGVQTCALPILADDEQLAREELCFQLGKIEGVEVIGQAARSEERRVGKECRSRGERDHEKKKEKKVERYAMKREKRGRVEGKGDEEESAKSDRT